MNNARSRGQSIVLFALTVLTVTLMVMMTLAFGMRAKEKIELQNMADAAAYSNAVQSARTFNIVALINRAEVASQVSMAGTKSLISWTTLYLATLKRMQRDIGIFTAATCAVAIVWPPCVPTCAEAGRQSSNISNKINDLENSNVYKDNGPDQAAGDQTRTQQSVSTANHQIQRYTYLGNTYKTDIFGPADLPNSLASTKDGTPGWLYKQRLTKEIVQKAMQGSKFPNEVDAPDLGDYVSIRETGTADDLWGTAPANAYAVSPRGITRELGVKAAMGSRGYEFVAGRSAGGPIALRVGLELGWIPPGSPLNVIGVTESGSGRWTGSMNRHAGPSAAPVGAVGEDDGTLFGGINVISACPLPFFGRIDAWVYGSDCGTPQRDTHTYNGGRSPDPNNGETGCGHRHTQGVCTNCPGVWTMFIDINPSHVDDQEAHLNGQPKNFAALIRDYGARCGKAWNVADCGQVDPWNMFFRYKFKSGEDVDLTGMQTFTGLDLSKQSVVSAGIAYYHRRDHWQEPPNFFNPFWRATLVSPAIDSEGDPDRGGTDLQDTLANTGDPIGGAMVGALDNAGYKAW